jgi:hypothetical protein
MLIATCVFAFVVFFIMLKTQPVDRRYRPGKPCFRKGE